VGEPEEGGRSIIGLKFRLAPMLDIRLLLTVEIFLADSSEATSSLNPFLSDSLLSFCAEEEEEEEGGELDLR